ncbi:MAG: toxin-antitoxin system HicB family antitoxin [Desulfobacula sp.]|uniref:toxin-antitoxin system HicB family antitoxin n=1 Tax=Desulfobacula sp. TaxID=2593537 RepID=UPI00345C0F69|nr:toxin-antitoxin system HicB family antitoxin [Desulfobacula sp.]
MHHIGQAILFTRTSCRFCNKNNLHADFASVATAEEKSLNQWIIDTLEHAVHI